MLVFIREGEERDSALGAVGLCQDSLCAVPRAGADKVCGRARCRACGAPCPLMTQELLSRPFYNQMLMLSCELWLRAQVNGT